MTLAQTLAVAGHDPVRRALDAIYRAGDVRIWSRWLSKMTCADRGIAPFGTGNRAEFSNRSASILGPLSPMTGALLCQLARVAEARVIVALGTSRGVAAIWLAGALRDAAHHQGDHCLIGFEPNPVAAQIARSALRSASVSRYVDIRCDDPRVALSSIDLPIDFVLIEDFDERAEELLRRIRPQLRLGAAIVATRIDRRRALGGYLRHVRDPSAGFHSLRLPTDGGIEISVKT